MACLQVMHGGYVKGMVPQLGDWAWN